MKQTTTTDTIVKEFREKLKEFLLEFYYEAQHQQEHGYSPEENIYEDTDNLLALFESAIQKTREETIKEIRESFKFAIVRRNSLPNGNTTLIEVTNDFLASLKEKQIKV